jgi:hypothetical protein
MDLGAMGYGCMDSGYVGLVALVFVPKQFR